jgi:hypothetical protein
MFGTEFNINFSRQVFDGFPQFLEINVLDGISVRQQVLPSESFPVHQSSYYLAPYRLDTDSIVK